MKTVAQLRGEHPEWQWRGNLPDFLTINQAVVYANKHPQTLRRDIADGLLRASQRDKHCEYRIALIDVDRYLQGLRPLPRTESSRPRLRRA